MTPRSSSARTRRKHCGADRCTRADRTTLEARPSACNTSRMLRSKASRGGVVMVNALAKNGSCGIHEDDATFAKQILPPDVQNLQDRFIQTVQGRAMTTAARDAARHP